MTGPPKIRVLLAEDSPVQRALLRWVIGEADGLDLVGEAVNGAEAVAQVKELRPDVVLMDCHMPVMDGVAATRLIMREAPCPIVMASASIDGEDVHPGLDALREGALAMVAKPADPSASNFDALCAELRLSLRLMSEVHVVRRLAPRQPATAAGRSDDTVVAIGASTGGPPVVLDILRRLGPTIGAPVLVVQHMAPGFLASFAAWLARGAKLPVTLAVAGEAAAPGRAYVAPEDRHLLIDARRRIVLDDGPAVGGFRPSINRLFAGVAEVCGPAAIAVQLTGMGVDGAEGMLAVARRGGITLGQDEETSVVFGMPGAAARLGAIQHLLPPARIAEFIQTHIARKSARP